MLMLRLRRVIDESSRRQDKAEAILKFEQFSYLHLFVKALRIFPETLLTQLCDQCANVFNHQLRLDRFSASLRKWIGETD